jgi:arylsulfatase A-like enzyme
MTEKPNIVWITLESVRYDHTSLSDYFRDTTPSLRQIADDPAGQSFSQCISHGKWTGTSSASILTGTYPSTHGIYGASDLVLSDEIATIPELLSTAGYSSLGIVSNPNAGPAKGLDRGFNEFKYVSPSTLIETVGYRTLVKSFLNIWEHGGGITTDIERHKCLSSYMMTDVAKRFATQQSAEKPFFLYLHYNSSHHPYLPPKAYLDNFVDSRSISPKTALNIAQSKYDDIHELIAHGGLSDEEWAAVVAMYDAVVAHVTQCAGHLVNAIQHQNNGETIFVITADHGDLLGEHGLAGHKLVVDDSLTHIPFVTHGLEGIEQHADQVVQPIDFIKTILMQIGIENEQLEGNLLTEESRNYAITQRSEQNAIKNLDRIRDLNPDYELSTYHPGMLTAFRSVDFKYLKSSERTVLYKLPNETEDVSDSYPDVAAIFDQYASEWLATHKNNATASQRDQELDPQIQEHLSNMGYL